MRPLTALLVALLLLVAGCGGDDGGGGGGGDEGAVREAVIEWTFEGKCEHMTDKFLEDQLLGLGKTREDRCELFEKQHQKPQYSEDDLKIEDVKVTGTKATLIVTSDIAPDIKSQYTLVKNGDQWQIDAADLQ